MHARRSIRDCASSNNISALHKDRLETYWRVPSIESWKEAWSIDDRNTCSQLFLGDGRYRCLDSATAQDVWVGLATTRVLWALIQVVTSAAKCRVKMSLAELMQLSNNDRATWRTDKERRSSE